ncbi:MAG: hypothetical protein QN120_13860 [Armatimonadota bacterium]|nr:hypothetical protein [Armatimonadota bacterium]
MACRESSLDFLRELGYTPIQLPREHIYPLDLVGKRPGAGAARHLGPLPRLMRTADAPPPMRQDELVGQITGRRTDKLDVGLGLHLLGKLLAALGALAISAKVGFERARQVEFSYEDVRSDSVDIIELREYLGRRPALDAGNPVIDDYFIGEGQVVVITRTLKSRSFGVTATDEQGQEIEVDVNVLQRNLAEVGVDVSAATRTKVSFRGPRPLVFAFQGLALHIDTGGLQVADDVPPEFGTLAARPAVPGEAVPVVLGRYGLLKLE